jgi:HEAT repeat protein
VEEIVENYDFVTHLIIPGGFYEGRRISGALFFIRLHEDVQEVTSNGVQKRLEKAGSSPSASDIKHTGKKSLNKKEIEAYVREYRFDQILSVAGEDKKLIRNLQRLLYSGDDLFRKRAADILGKASAVLSKSDPGTISKLLQGLFYSISDTAAFTWGAFEAIGEIIKNRVDMFAGYIPQLYQYLPDDTRRAQVIEAVGRIAQQKPDLFRKTTFHFIPFLSDPDPLVRGYAAWLLGNLGAYEVREDLERLRQENSEISIYENGELEHKTVGQVASEALGKLNA